MAVQIKRYANRKLYNTETSRYITLGDISDLVREGREIQVVDNETGHDISSLVLSRVLVDTERRGSPVAAGAGEGLPTDFDGSPVLGELLQRQLVSLYTLLRRYAGDVQGNLSGVRDNVVRWIQANAAGGEDEDLASAGPRRELEVTIEAAVERAIRELDLPTRSDFDRLERLLQRLSSRLNELPSGPDNGA